MKRFRFRLEAVRRWRQEQARAEELKLERLREEQAASRRALEALEGRAAAESAGVMKDGRIEASALGVLDAYRRHAHREAARITVEIGQWEQRIQEQRGHVLEARRQARLLDRLHERQLQKWKSEASREEDQLAGELFLARMASIRKS